MPHDSLQRVAGTAVVQTVLGTCTELRQATAPEWSGAAPAGTDVVLHEETVLYEVGIWPDLLVGVARHGNAKSDARFAIEKFRNLTSDQRAAIIFFCESI